ncbi:unnamed protein product [Rhodiola kirilowii]
MEFSLFSFFLCSTFAIFVFLVSRLVQTSNSTNPKLPPGPWKLPLIGNMHQLASSAPHQTLRDLARKYGPLMHLQLGEVSTVVVSSPEIAKEVMKTHDAIFASRPHLMASRILSYGSRNIAFAPYGDYWRQLRKICAMELLSPKRVASFKHIREQEVSCLTELIARSEGQAINLSKNIYSTVYSITSRAAFGKTRDMEKMIPYIQEGMKIGAGFNVADYFPSISLLHAMSGIKTRLEALHKEIDKVLSNIISDHQLSLEETNNDGEAVVDLVHVLLKMKDDAESMLSINDIKAVILDIIAAGSETAASVVDWVMSELLKNPSMMEKVQDEVRKVFDETGEVNESGFPNLEYLNLVIKETLRLHIPGPLLLPRECGEKCVINGYVIPAKTKVIINAGAMARDPEYWVDPEKFIPERFLNSSIQFKGNDFEYIPFGAGRRICPGISFGMANVEHFLAQMLFHFDWKLGDGLQPQEMDMSESFGISVWRKQQLSLVPSVYKKSSLVHISSSYASS